MNVRSRAASSFVVLAALFSSGSTRAADPFNLKGTPAGTIPADGSGGEVVSAATVCKACHSGSALTEGSPAPTDGWHLPYDLWAGTMMANANRDPAFRAALAVTNQDSVTRGDMSTFGADFGTYCLRCHASAAHVQGHTVPADGSALDDADRQGTGCDTCHRATDNRAYDPGAPYIGNAQIVWEPGPTKYGPYADANMVQFPSAQLAYTSSSELCGNCHDSSSPVETLHNEAGADLAVPFPFDTTYTEWKSSSFAVGATQQSCQSCHMKRHPTDASDCNVFGNVLRPKPARHTFAGGNVWGVQAVQLAEPSYAALHAIAFDFAEDLARTMLSEAVTIEGPTAPVDATAGGNFVLPVKITNKTGHKFPAGFEGRRAFVQVAWQTGSGEEIVLGAYDAASDTIASSPPTRIYRAVHGRVTAGSAPVPTSHMREQNVIIEDTRIPPAGFSPLPTTRPRGPVQFEQPPGTWNHFDDAKLALIAPDAVGDHDIVVRVMYQSITKAFVDEMATANTTNTDGTTLKSIWEQTGKAAPLEIATATFTVHVEEAPPEPIPEAGPDAEPDGAGGAGAGGSAAKASGDSGGCGCRVIAAKPATSSYFFGFLVVGGTLLRRVRRALGKSKIAW